MPEATTMILLPLVLPFLLGLAAMLVLPTAVAPVYSQRAAICVLTIILGVLFTTLLLMPDGTVRQSLTLDSALIANVSLTLLGALCIAAPLLDRARYLGLTFAAIVGSFAVQSCITALLWGHLPAIADASRLPITLVVTLLIGVIGGINLPLHPARFTAQGVGRPNHLPQGVMLAGWVLLTIALIGVSGLSNDGVRLATLGSVLAATLVGGIATLLSVETAHGRDGLLKAGEGMAAGALIVLLTPATPLAAACLGLLASLLVMRSESIAQALRLDDPHHFVGAVLAPAMLGVLMPGLFDLKFLSAAMQWLGGACLLGFGLAILLWPLAMLLLGITLPARLVREGVRT